MQKLSINAGFTCPNRDGTKDNVGCYYCNNTSFRPAYCASEKSITQQLDEGINFFEHKYPAMRYLAYFQSYSNTYGQPDLLEDLYTEALKHDKVDGLVIGTRPDCVDEKILQIISALAKKYFVTIEYGIESTIEATLQRINRQHTFQEAKQAILQTKALNIHVGAHLILGLPGETRKDMLNHAAIISELPIDFLKLHQLQIVEGTVFAGMYRKSSMEFQLFSADEYLDLLVHFMERLRPDICLERFVNQVPSDMLIAPKWGLKNFEMIDKLNKRFAARSSWQGKLFNDDLSI